MDPLLTPAQAAETLSCTVKTVHRLCREGRLAYVRISGRGERRFTPEHIRDFIEAETVQTRIDKTRPNRVACSPKGGARRKSVGVEGQGLRKEIRDLCQ